MISKHSRTGRAAAICRHVHSLLLGSRRQELEAIKKGFLFAVDLRVPLQLFTIDEIHNLCCPKRWLEPQAVVDAFVFMSGPSDKHSDGGDGGGHNGDVEAGADEGVDNDDVAIGLEWRDTAFIFRELLLKWGVGEHAEANRLQQLLQWVTGVGELPRAGDEIKVIPADSSKHLPSAATCSSTLKLPPLETGGIAVLGHDAALASLQASLLTAMRHKWFSRA